MEISGHEGRRQLQYSSAPKCKMGEILTMVLASACVKRAQIKKYGIKYSRSNIVHEDILTASRELKRLAEIYETETCFSTLSDCSQ